MSKSTTEEELERIIAFLPMTVRKRRLCIDILVQELDRRNFKDLDESSEEDLAKVTSIAEGLFPDNTPRKIREYAGAAIRLWKKTRN